MKLLTVLVAVAVLTTACAKTKITNTVMLKTPMPMLSQASNAVNCPAGGSHLAIYADMDANGSVGATDLLQFETDICNGVPAAPDVQLIAYNSQVCTQIAETGTYITVGSNTSTLYGNANCTPNSKLTVLNTGEVFWANKATLITSAQTGAIAILFTE